MSVSAFGDLELAVLLAISRLEGDAYGLRLRDEVSDLRARDYAVGAIYTTLQRLEDKGLVRSRMSHPLPVRGGRARRVYVVTAAGARALRDGRAAAARLWSVDAKPA